MTEIEKKNNWQAVMVSIVEEANREVALPVQPFSGWDGEGLRWIWTGYSSEDDVIEVVLRAYLDDLMVGIQVEALAVARTYDPPNLLWSATTFSLYLVLEAFEEGSHDLARLKEDLPAHLLQAWEQARRVSPVLGRLNSEKQQRDEELSEQLARLVSNRHKREPSPIPKAEVLEVESVEGAPDEDESVESFVRRFFESMDKMSAADLAGVDLREIDLSGKDLSGKDLHGKDLGGADLRGVNLRSADLSGANLSGATLTGADLTHASLRGVNLHKKHLKRVNLSGANLNMAKLSGANLEETILTGADLTRAELFYTDLSGKDLRGTNLSSADLTGANLSKANLSSADLTRATLSGANLTEANLLGAEVTREQLDTTLSVSGAIMPDGSTHD